LQEIIWFYADEFTLSESRTAVQSDEFVGFVPPTRDPPIALPRYGVRFARFGWSTFGSDRSFRPALRRDIGCVTLFVLRLPRLQS
jgi:hypothetical protein